MAALRAASVVVSVWLIAACGGTSAPATDSPTQSVTTSGASSPSPPGAAPGASSGTGALTLPPPSSSLAWSDEFDGTSMDWSKWSMWPYEGSGNRGDDRVSADTLSVQNGVLAVTIFDSGGVHHVGLINTQGKFEFKYGYIEARIQFNDSPGAWCSFWLQSPALGQIENDPSLGGTEIDVMEHPAYDNSGNYVGDGGSVNLHWNPYGPTHQGFGTRVNSPTLPLQGNWHTYGLLWTDSGYTWFIDRVPVWQVNQYVSQRTEYVFLTCEVGDLVWAGSVPAGGYGTAATSTTKMLVDYVRVWQP